MQRFEVKSHASSLLPDGKQWKLVWNDEFDGTALDTTKWDYRLHMMGRRCPHWTKDAISFDGNSNIVFHLVEIDGVYCSTQLQTGYNFMDLPREEYTESTENKNSEGKREVYFSWPIGEIREPKFMHKYGYYECRCKLQQRDGWWSAFWLQSPVIGSTLDPKYSGVEVDIMEDFSRDNYVEHTNHWNGYSRQHKNAGARKTKCRETPDGYHVFGLEWTPKYYRYYVDGELTDEIQEPVSEREQFILISTEAMGYRVSNYNKWDALKTAVGDTFVVDYVRVFDEV